MQLQLRWYKHNEDECEGVGEIRQGAHGGCDVQRVYEISFGQRYSGVVCVRPEKEGEGRRLGNEVDFLHRGVYPQTNDEVKEMFFLL